MTTNTNSTNGDDAQADLEGTVKVGGHNITAVTDDSADELLGWIVPFTIGNDFIVDRDWLETRASDLGLSQAMLPRPVTPRRAFTRAGKRLDDRYEQESSDDGVQVKLNKVAYEKRYEIEVHDRRPEDDFDGTLLGAVEFDTETDDLRMRANVSRAADEMWGLWEDVKGDFRDEWNLMQASNTGEDVRGMLRGFFKRRSTSVKFRAGGGVYFAPQATGDVVQRLDTLMDDIDREWKKAGFPCEMDVIEVQDADDKRSMVEEKVRRDLERQVREYVQDALEELDEGEVAQEVSDELETSLEDVEDFAQQYNALLDAKMTVREYLQEWKEDTAGDAEQMVDDVLGRL